MLLKDDLTSAKNKKNMMTCACPHFGRFAPHVGQSAPAHRAKRPGVAALPFPYFIFIYNLFIIYEAIDFIKNQLSEPNEH